MKILILCGQGESNSRPLLGKQVYCHYTTLAISVFISKNIQNFKPLSKKFLKKLKKRVRLSAIFSCASARDRIINNQYLFAFLFYIKPFFRLFFRRNRII